MAKTSDTQTVGGFTRFGTLSNVVDEIKETNRLLGKQGQALNNFIANQGKAAALSAKDDLESGREGKGGKGGIGSKILGAGRGGLKGLGAISGLSFLTKGIRTLIQPIVSGLGFLLKPLKFLFKILRKGGPIGLVIGTMFLLFKDIANNKTFMDTLKNIKETWTNTIVPLFKSIKESVAAIEISDGVKETFNNIKDWFVNFKTQIQDWIVGNLKIITDTIAGVLEGVDLLLKGDWKAGISKIGSTLFNGIKNFFDNTMTNILEMFGVDFGEGGTFLSKAGEIISSLTVNMINKWNDFKQGVKDTWNGLVNFFTGEDGYVKTTIRNIKETMQNAWDTFVLGVKVSWNNTTTKVKQTVSDLLEPLTVTLPNKIGEIKDGLIDTWNNIKSKVMEALTNVSLWFMFKPKELGLLLEEKWIETKGAFMEKLASFAGLLTTIPAQLKLLSLKTIRDIPGGKFLVSDNRIANAQREVNQGQAFASAILESTLSKTQEDLARIARERKELEAQKTQMEEAAKFLISQNNPTTTITTTNLNPNAGAVGDPYANSYMGRHVAGP